MVEHSIVASVIWVRLPVFTLILKYLEDLLYLRIIKISIKNY